MMVDVFTGLEQLERLAEGKERVTRSMTKRLKANPRVKVCCLEGWTMEVKIHLNLGVMQKILKEEAQCWMIKDKAKGKRARLDQ